MFIIRLNVISLLFRCLSWYCCCAFHCCTLVAQLTEIRKFKYAKVMCENADYLPWIQPYVFFHPLSVVVNNIAK